MDRGFRQRRADGLRAAPGRGPGCGPADHRLGEGTGQGRARGRHGPAPRPRLPRPAPRQRLPPPRQRRGERRPPGWQRRRRERRRARPGPGRAAAGSGAGGRRGAGRVRRPGHPDRPAGHPGPPGRTARRAVRPRPHRPVAGPGSGRRGRAEPEDDVVRDRDRPARARHRPRLRPPRAQEPPETRRTRPAAGRDRVYFHPGQPGRAARRLRHLAAAHPRTRTGPDHHPGPADHRALRPPARSRGHDPGVKLRHLSQVRHATCTSPICRRPAAQCDFEHNTPYEAGGRTCLCNGGPKCRHDHRLKQHPKWKVDQLPDGTFRWTTPAGRTYTTEPTRYPI